MEKRRKRNNEGESRERSEFDQKVVEVKRVTRVVAGGKRMRFRALVLIGDHKGKVGMGLAKGLDVSESVNKAVNHAKKAMISLPLVNDTIPHELNIKYKSSKLLLKPARQGTGVIAGGAIRSVMELTGGMSVGVCDVSLRQQDRATIIKNGAANISPWRSSPARQSEAP
jgi:small subunit ribosomal protein S5